MRTSAWGQVRRRNRDELLYPEADKQQVDLDAFSRDGYVALRGAFGADTAAACRAVIWDALDGQEISADDPAAWPPLAELDALAGGPFTAAGSSPALTKADQSARGGAG
ncbi:MAG TPA: hypothetical protein VE979_25345 [Streptosporangiaceae bacterium]|nr:hypothetical protein [Streptosporangiaceae bacterium]